MVATSRPVVSGATENHRMALPNGVHVQVSHPWASSSYEEYIYVLERHRDTNKTGSESERTDLERSISSSSTSNTLTSDSGEASPGSLASFWAPASLTSPVRIMRPAGKVDSVPVSPKVVCDPRLPYWMLLDSTDLSMITVPDKKSAPADINFALKSEKIRSIWDKPALGQPDNVVFYRVAPNKDLQYWHSTSNDKKLYPFQLRF